MHAQKDTASSTAIGVGIILALLASASCIKPDQEDDFFTGSGSSVTGDDTSNDDEDESAGTVDDDRQGDDDDQREEAESDEEASMPREADDDEELAVDAAQRPTEGPTVRVDAGRAPADAGQPSARADAQAEPSAPSSDAGMEPASGPAPTKLTFKVTTATMRGRYAPKHVLAIWVTDAQGKFVKTLAKHAFIRARYLTGWNSASGGNVVDATTSATLNAHGARTLTWNLTDVMKRPVPDGDYKIVMELTENDRTGVTATVPFTKGPGPAMVMPADAPSFTSMSLVLE